MLVNQRERGATQRGIQGRTKEEGKVRGPHSTLYMPFLSWSSSFSLRFFSLSFFILLTTSRILLFFNDLVPNMCVHYPRHCTQEHTQSIAKCDKKISSLFKKDITFLTKHFLTSFYFFLSIFQVFQKQFPSCLFLILR